MMKGEGQVPDRRSSQKCPNLDNLIQISNIPDLILRLNVLTHLYTNRNYSAILAILQITSYALDV